MGNIATAGAAHSFVAHDAPVKAVRVSPTGALLATGDTKIQIRIWRNEELLFHFDPHSNEEKVWTTERIRGLEFSNDEKQLYVSASDTLQCYSLESGSLEWEYRAPRFLGFLIVSPQAIAVSTGGLIAASFDHGTISTFSPEGRRLVHRSDNYAPRMMGFSPHGKAIVGADGFNLCVWDAASGERAHRWRLENRVFAMAVSKTEPLVATRELHTLSLWDIDKFEKICELPAARGLPLLAFSPTERVLITGERHRIRLVNLECRGVRDFDSEESTILAITFSADGRKVIAGCSDCRVRVWDREG
jgi:WD40 repeat protein